MASPLSLILPLIFIFFLVSSHAATSKPKPTGFIIPIGKNKTTLQYYANVIMAGNAVKEERLLIHLGGLLLWFNCDNYKSPSYRPIRCKTKKCQNAQLEDSCIQCYGTPKPGCSNNTCGVYGYNPYGNFVYSQGLGEDNITVSSTNGVAVGPKYVMSNFVFSCNTDSSILDGLASDITGLLGLAQQNYALHKQISSAFKLPHKFYLCIPPVNDFEYGSMFIGGGPIYLSPSKNDFSKSLFTTPLLTNPVGTAPIFSEIGVSDEYFIGVKSIKIDGKVVSLNTSLLAIDPVGFGGTKISTIVPYTVLHTNIYNAITNEFVKAAVSRKIKRVASVKPFGACFDSKTVTNTTTGPNVPTIDLVLQSKDVYWRIIGHNSMVTVKKGVMCLAFNDGGLNPRTSIVLGGYQLEDNVLEFDLVSSKFGFSNSLLLHNTKCAQTRVL